MSTDKKYYFHQKPMIHQEAQVFLEKYKHSIRRSFDRYTRMLPHVPLHSYVLDYGCGWGAFSEMIYLERQCRVDGIDLDSNSIEIACDLIGKREGLSFALKRIQELPDGIYDIVISTQVAEHTLNPGNYLRECNRVLQVGGCLIISVPNILTPRYFLSILGPHPEAKFRAISETSKNQRDRTRDHVQAWDPLTFCRLVSSLGFEYETHEFLEGIALPFGRYWRRPWGFLRHWSYTMLFKMRKVEFVNIAPDD